MAIRAATPVETEFLKKIDEAADRLVFLSEVSRVLSGALTDRECFERLLELVVPRVADWATLTIVDEQGELKRVAANHRDPKKRELLRGIGSRYSAQTDDLSGPGYTIRKGESEFVPDYGIQFEKYLGEVRYPGLVEVLRAVGVRSKISVPIRAHGQVLGALWLATSEAERVLTREDLVLAEEIAARAGNVVYHLVLYARATRKLDQLEIENVVREHFLSQVRHDVRSILSAAKVSAQLIERTDESRRHDLVLRIISAVDRAVQALQVTKSGETSGVAA